MRGKVLLVRFFWSAIRDHPRTCGEKLKTVVQDGRYLGSPPHMRGKD